MQGLIDAWGLNPTGFLVVFCAGWLVCTMAGAMLAAVATVPADRLNADNRFSKVGAIIGFISYPLTIYIIL